MEPKCRICKKSCYHERQCVYDEMFRIAINNHHPDCNSAAAYLKNMPFLRFLGDKGYDPNNFEHVVRTIWPEYKS